MDKELEMELEQEDEDDDEIPERVYVAADDFEESDESDIEVNLKPYMSYLNKLNWQPTFKVGHRFWVV